MIYQAQVGQSAPVLLGAQFVDEDGQPATPTGAAILVLGGSPLVVLATLAPSEVAGVTGLMLAELDVSNVVTFPAAQYLVRWSGTTSAKPTATMDTLQILNAAAFASPGVLGAAYTTEERVRHVNKALADTVVVESSAVALEAARAADYINGRLAGKFTVPFTAPYDPYVVLLNDWYAAADLLDRHYGENGNMSDHAKQLRDTVDKALDALLEGASTLPASPPTVTGGAMAFSTEDKMASDNMPNIYPARATWRR